MPPAIAFCLFDCFFTSNLFALLISNIYLRERGQSQVKCYREEQCISCPLNLSGQELVFSMKSREHTQTPDDTNLSAYRELNPFTMMPVLSLENLLTSNLGRKNFHRTSTGLWMS